MSRYETDEEQWESIKQWWKENGKQIVLAVIVALAGVTGWNYWQQMQYSKAVNASSTFELLQTKFQQGQFQDVAREVQKLKTEQPDSPYAAGAAFLLATYLYEDKHDFQGALSQLDWVAEHVPEAAMKDIAQLRAARILIDQKNYTEAQLRLQKVAVARLAEESQALYHYVEGELALAEGDLARARKAFDQVLNNPKVDAGLKQLAQLQRDDLTEQKP
jgi:predicted negative regulator of RcsB-dependent stress response